MCLMKVVCNPRQQIINRFNFKTLLKSTFTNYDLIGVFALGSGGWGGGGCWNSMGKVLSEEVSRFVISKEKLFLLFLLKHAFFLSQPYVLPTCWKGSSI